MAGVDVVLAGVASGGFAVFQNSPWRVVWVSIVCGAVGYAIRAIALNLEFGLAFVAGAMVSGLVIGVRLASFRQAAADRRASTTTERGCAV